ncbi:4-hydroxybenzoate polyprenyltransferase, putative [Candidatus Koribacter versatilis Ellin345]|uniref:4-hydroxybenzoate polyprenyltransferase n=1 Tax=Koribacter versatilis (strain Ellin345) TaxID=204669 RepID=Q1IKI7_KORVE|nr:UbiA-like polyprenyltransferase [Candidatus Koribacter versatilis]ABF42613.1 4-hydroxybenzoate polyprenyltransferase, putative [Candidatus Koribacter versatilis Ellin345]
MGFFRNIGTTLEMIKWEHSVFALPFALCGAMLAAHGIPSGRQLLWIIVAMVSARSAAMAFNRWVDARIDAANPRTKMRAIPAGLLTSNFVLVFTLIAAAIFFVAASQLNALSLMLSPIVLVVLLGYSLTKRFTRWSHVVLGFALGMAPAGAWIAVRGSLDPRILLLTAAVTFWTAGFDVLYSCQDYEHDVSAGLHSIPRYLGIANALIVARVFHLLMLTMLALFIYAFQLGGIGIAGLVTVAALIFYEHTLVKPNDLSKLNAAFFTMNGVIAILFFVFVATKVLLTH